MALPEVLTHGPLVILTGAGASVPLGLNTTAEFRQRFYDMQLRERIVDEDPEFFEFVTTRLGGAGAAGRRDCSDRLPASGWLGASRLRFGWRWWQISLTHLMGAQLNQIRWRVHW